MTKESIHLQNQCSSRKFLKLTTSPSRFSYRFGLSFMGNTVVIYKYKDDIQVDSDVIESEKVFDKMENGLWYFAEGTSYRKFKDRFKTNRFKIYR